MSELLGYWHGLFLLPFWGYLLVALGLTHLTIISITLFLHRTQAHRSLHLKAPISHLFRFWLWLTTGMITRQWVAVHRKHHATCETCDDPHSPVRLGIRAVLWRGIDLYRAAASNEDTARCYGSGTPDDFLERHLYTPHPTLGVSALLVLHLVLFGLPGLAIWAVQMLWIPLFAAGVINGLGHWSGYRNFTTRDASTNLINLAVLIGGEELHNNHHAYPASARFSMRWWELDVGWLYIGLLRMLGQARVLSQAPRLILRKTVKPFDADTVRMLVANRIVVMSQYARRVVLPAFRHEARHTTARYRQLLKRLRQAVMSMEYRLPPADPEQLRLLLDRYPRLQEVMEFQRRLQLIFRARHEGYQILQQRLTQWCVEAETTGIDVLQQFARRLGRYSLTSA